MSSSIQHLLAPLALGLAVVVLCADRADAQEDDPEKTAVEMMKPAERSVERGLTWLASRQQNDGSFGSGAYRGNVAVTSLAGMAMMTGGSTPGRGPHGAEVSRALNYILLNTQQGGFIEARGAASHGPMYGHGFATLFLAECYGMSSRPELREKLSKAVRLIVNSQNREGGWRYQPQRVEGDISVTICQVMALRAARNAGIGVPSETVDRCISYVKKSRNADGGFMYQLTGGESEFARSAAGIVALYSAGVYKGKEIDEGLAYLMRFLPKKGEVRQVTNYHYGHYYAVQAMWQAGGKFWRQWYPGIRDELIDKQRDDGSWMSAYSAEYATAMSLIILQLPENHLPIFRR
ncbi:MAG: terpene cyclase/mutase family protein [Candidatus Nealsonbacteria bacterium]|nr:terpene cyclase/mutase family protein [Candidatus Nealsonbacteria bacterium]